MGLIGTAIGAAGSIYGGIQSSKAMRKAIKNINEQKKKNQDWYDQRYNEDATQRADAQALLTMTEEAIKNRNRQAAGKQAVMGGTEESVAAEKAANNEALAGAVSNINAQGEARKENIEQQYQANEKALNDQLNNLQIGKANNIAQATQGLTSTLSGLSDTLDLDNKVLALFKKKDKSGESDSGEGGEE